MRELPPMQALEDELDEEEMLKKALEMS